MNDVHHFRSSTPSFLISAEPPSQVEQRKKEKIDDKMSAKHFGYDIGCLNKFL